MFGRATAPRFLVTIALLAPMSATAAGPSLKEGDSFTYRSKGKSFTQVYEGTEGQGSHVFRVNGDKIVMNHSMSFVELPGTKAIPHNGQLDLDLSRGFVEGDSWAVSYTVAKSGGSRSSKERRCSVVAHDPSRTVPAGTFDAYRVDCEIETKGKGTRYSESWYDAHTWRTLEHRVGNSKDSLKLSLELIDMKLRER